MRKGHVAATVSAASRARITVSAFLRTRHRRTDGASLCVPKDLQGAWRHRASRQLSRWLTAIHTTSLSFPFVSSKTRRRIALLAASLHRRGTAPSPAPRRRCTVPAPSSASCASITLRMWYLPRPFAPFHLRDGLSSSYATALRELRWHVILDRTLTVRGGACVLTLGDQRTETAFRCQGIDACGHVSVCGDCVATNLVKGLSAGPWIFFVFIDVFMCNNHLQCALLFLVQLQPVQLARATLALRASSRDSKQARAKMLSKNRCDPSAMSTSCWHRKLPKRIGRMVRMGIYTSRCLIFSPCSRARPAESRARGPSSWPRGNSWARGHSPGKPLCSVSRAASNLTLVRVKIDAQARQT